MAADSSLDSPTLALLIDAGGSKTSAAIGYLEQGGRGRIVARCQAGPGNPRAVGWEAASAAWAEAAQQAIALGGEAAPTGISCVVCGIAGAGRPDLAARMLEWWQARFPQARVIVVPDVALLVAAGSADGAGIALVAGTGSIAWGISPRGEVARAGGWGFQLGDEGGGAWIGLQALKAIVQHADGRGPATCLTEVILRQLACKTVGELPDWLRQVGNIPRQLAALAPSVLEVAREGDAVAAGILEAAAQKLADLVRCVARRLDWDNCPLPIAVGGGVLVHFDEVRTRVAALLRQDGIEAALTVVNEPLEGALRVTECRLLAGEWEHWTFASVGDDKS